MVLHAVVAHRREELPSSWDALELMHPARFERELGTGDEIRQRSRDERLAR